MLGVLPWFQKILYVFDMVLGQKKHSILKARSIFVKNVGDVLPLESQTMINDLIKL